MDAAETVQAYLHATLPLLFIFSDWTTGSDESLCECRKWEQPSHPTADLQLAAFEKVIVAKGAQKTVELTIPPRQMACASNSFASDPADSSTSGLASLVLQTID